MFRFQRVTYNFNHYLLKRRVWSNVTPKSSNVVRIGGLIGISLGGIVGYQIFNNELKKDSETKIETFKKELNRSERRLPNLGGNFNNHVKCSETISK